MERTLWARSPHTSAENGTRVAWEFLSWGRRETTLLLRKHRNQREVCGCARAAAGCREGCAPEQREQIPARLGWKAAPCPLSIPTAYKEQQLLPDLHLQPTQPICQTHRQFLHQPEGCPPVRRHVLQKCGYCHKSICCSLSGLRHERPVLWVMASCLHFLIEHTAWSPFFLFVAVPSSSFDATFIRAGITSSDIYLEILCMWLRNKEISKWACRKNISPLIHFPSIFKMLLYPGNRQQHVQK